MKPRHLLQFASQFAAAGINTVFPPACPKCRRPTDTLERESTLCDTCVEPLVFPADEMCPRCALSISRLAIKDGRCPRCRYERYSFDQILCLGPYRGELGSSIVRMKHTNEQPLAFAMGKLMGERMLLTRDRLPDCLVPMPTHWRRRLRRGSNPAETLAAGVSQVTQVPVCSGRLRVRRLTQKQSLLSPSQRRNNVRGAFAVPPSWRGDNLGLMGKHVALVDDAVTTGATVEAAAATLKESGVASILVVAVARANR